MSKKFMVVLGIVVILGAIIFAFFSQSSVPQTSQIETHSATDSPAQVAQSYFDAYSNCLKNPPDEARGQVSTYCQSNNDHAGNGLSVNLDSQAAKGGAPVICSQNPPLSAAPKETSEISTDTAMVIMKEEFGENFTIEVTYYLSLQDGKWEVTNIVCPQQ